METWAANIVELVSKHRDQGGWFMCASCGKKGYIEKKFELQERGEVWEPFLRGIVPLGSPKDTYQPFVFLVSSAKNGPTDSVWFSYYKDLRKDGGRLKLGYGPGGPPVLGNVDVLQLVRQLREIGCISQKDIDKALK
jgi:hypothetical protein